MDDLRWLECTCDIALKTVNIFHLWAGTESPLSGIAFHHSRIIMERTFFLISYFAFVEVVNTWQLYWNWQKVEKCIFMKNFIPETKTGRTTMSSSIKIATLSQTKKQSSTFEHRHWQHKNILNLCLQLHVLLSEVPKMIFACFENKTLHMMKPILKHSLSDQPLLLCFHKKQVVH